MTEVSPHLFVDAVLSYQKTAAIKAAIELDLFTKIGAGAGTAEALARENRGVVTRLTDIVRLPDNPRFSGEIWRDLCPDTIHGEVHQQHLAHQYVEHNKVYRRA